MNNYSVIWVPAVPAYPCSYCCGASLPCELCGDCVCASPTCAAYHTCALTDCYGDSRPGTPVEDEEPEKPEPPPPDTGGSDTVRSSYKFLATTMQEQHEKWILFEEGLYIRMVPLTELNRCWIVQEGGERRFGTVASDFKRVLEKTAWCFPVAFVINLSDQQTVRFEVGESPKHAFVKQAVRQALSVLVLVVSDDGGAVHLEASLAPEESPTRLRVNVKDKLTMATLRCWNDLEFWRPTHRD